MSRRNGNREQVLAEVQQLMIELLDEKIEYEEFVVQIAELCREHDWLVQFDTLVGVSPLEQVRAEFVKVSPRPRVVPFSLKKAA